MSHHHMEKLPSGIFNFCLRDSKKSLNEVIENLRAQEIFVNIRKGSIRASVHHYNDQNDVDHLVNVLKEVI
jgi:selenocysteine lyase/cysteine desulfurase